MRLRRSARRKSERRKAPLCRVGRSYEPAKAGGTAAQAARQASSRRGMHTARRRDSLGWNIGSNEPPDHHAQSRELELLVGICTAAVAPGRAGSLLGQPAASRDPPAASARSRIRSSSRARDRRDPSWESRTSSRARKYSSAMLRAASTAIFRVSPGRGLLLGEPHLLVDERRQLGDVGRVERAADRIPLPVDLDGDDAARLVHSPLRSPVPRVREPIRG